MDTQSIVKALRDSNAIEYGEFELSQGGTSKYYIDKYQFETDPESLELIAEAFAERVSDTKLAGVALGAVPLVTATSVETGNPYVIARKQEKDHGTGNLIEGNLAEDEEVVIIEDVATTGQSAIDAANALRDTGATVYRVMVVVDREEGASEALADENLELEALVTASDILEDENVA